MFNYQKIHINKKYGQFNKSHHYCASDQVKHKQRNLAKGCFTNINTFTLSNLNWRDANDL